MTIYTNDVGIAPMRFGPCLFQNEDPELVFIGLAEEGLSIQVDRHEVINQNLLNDSINSQLDLVDAIGIELLISKHTVDPTINFSNCGNSRQEIAIAKTALNNILGFYLAVKQFRVIEYFGYSLPLAIGGHILDLPQTLTAGWEFGIRPFFIP